MESVMIGHQCVIDLRKQGKKPRTVFFFIGECQYINSDYFAPERAIERFRHPEVWVMDSRAKDCDLSFVRNLKIHLLCADKTDITRYLEWWLALVAEQPALLIGIDSDDELNIWRKS
jgi:hypothetical protein